MEKCSVCKEKFEEKYFDAEQNKCVLHCHKNENNGWYTFDKNNKKEWNPEKVKLFWEAIQKDLKSKDDYENGVYENNNNPEREYTEYIDYAKPLVYEKVIFPCFQEEPTNSIGTNFYTISETVYSDNNIKKNEVKIFQDKNLEFINCHFLGQTDFKKYTFSRSLQFFNSYFYKNDIDFSEKIFNNFLFFKDCKNIGKLNLEKSTVHGSASFRGSDFSEVDFDKTTFKDIVVFTESKFHKDVNFQYTTFEKLALFRKTIFEKTVNFEDAIIKEEANFLEITSKEDKIEAIDVKNRETARIIKNSFEQQNNIIEANRFYALEMEKREKELDKNIKNGENIIEWLIFKIHSISSDHSQSAYLAFLWIFNLSYLYIIYCSKSSVIDNIIAFSAIAIILVSMIDMKNALKIGLTISLLEFQVFSNVKLDVIADKINPFSIMNSWDEIPFKLLLFKVIIAYLIYQFIISVRQNTRRK